MPNQVQSSGGFAGGGGGGGGTVTSVSGTAGYVDVANGTTTPVISLDSSFISRITTLENNEYKVAYFASVSASSGTITIPTNATILTDQFPGGVDALVSTISSGQPTGINPQASGGALVDVTSFDTGGNYVLTGTPSAFPVAIIYILSIAAKDWNNLTIGNILEYEASLPVQSVSGVTNRIIVTGAKQNPVVDISAIFEALLGKVANPLSQFASTTSAQLAGVISDETGSGLLVFGTTPTFTTNITTPLIIGGTGTTSTLALRSTSGTGATGADIIFQTGTNGATEAMRVLNSGNVGIGTTTSSVKLSISDSTNNVGIFRVLGISNVTTWSGNNAVAEFANSSATSNNWSLFQFSDNSSGAGSCGFAIKYTDRTNHYGDFYIWSNNSDSYTTRFGIVGKNIAIASNASIAWGTSSGSGISISPTAMLHLPAGTATASTAPLKFTSGTNLTITEAGAIEYNGTHLYFTALSAGTRYQLDQQGVSNYIHNILTPTTGSTISLTNNQYNIINPAGALLALTINLPSTPSNNDVVFIKFTQNITTVTYANGTVVDGITAPTAGGLTVLVYDSGTTSWY